MHEMGWSWEELQTTPIYVRRYCWDLIQIQRQVQREKQEQAEREAKRA